MSPCHQCGTPLPQPQPRFCPQCGAATAPVAAAYQPAPAPLSATVDFGHLWATHKQTWITMGIWLVGFFLYGGPAFTLLGLAWLVAFPLLVLDALNLPFYAQAPVWLRRPTLGAAVSVLATLTALVPGGLTFGWFLIAWGSWRFVKDSLARGETLGPIDLRLLWVGWRRWLVIGVVLAAWTFSAPWEGGSYVSGYSYTSGDWRYWVPGRSFGDGSGMATGAATFPSLLLMGSVIWAAWRGAAGSVPAWFRYIPAGVAPILVLLAITHMGADEAVTGISVTWSAVGPFLFIILLAPFYVAAVQFARGKN